MTEPASTSVSKHTSRAADQRLRRRYAAERRFRWYGRIAISLALVALFVIIGSLTFRGFPALFQHELDLEIHYDPSVIDPNATGERRAWSRADYTSLVRAALRDRFPEVQGRREKRRLYALVSGGATYDLRADVLEDPSLIGRTEWVALPLSDDADLYFKGAIDPNAPESERTLADDQIAWLDALDAEQRVTSRLSKRFLTSGDSREPELAGIWGAVVGSFLTLVVTLAVSFPIGVAASAYLEEFAPRNRLTDFIEVNINNLAAVPSIVFGLLGLAVFLNFFGLPRSAPLVGGLVLALMTLPTVIIASRSALAAVPPSIREAALGMGASPLQTLMHHVLPLALPGILTGTILGMARALGETAPLLMIGMVAFIVDVPRGLAEPATVLPVQIYLWADSPERAFVAKTSAAILVLLVFLVAMNLTAVLLRRRFERRW